MVQLSPLRSYAPTDVLHRDDEGRPLTVRLPTGHRAEFQRRTDDCMAAAVATVLNLPYDDVPDSRLDEKTAAGDRAAGAQATADLAAWANERGLRMTYHSELPTDRGAWLGCDSRGGPGQGHVIVMCEDRVVHDPASNWPCPPGSKVDTRYVLDHGITFDPKDAP